jgi:type IV pilus assembly protein PilA
MLRVCYYRDSRPSWDARFQQDSLGHEFSDRSKNQKMRKYKGFSLIELLIVVAIILIIAAIAIPNLLRARMAANESSAVASVRTINTGMVTYNSTYPTIGYATALTNLGGVSPCTPSSTTACLVDSVLSAGAKSGYNFAATGSGGPPQSAYYATGVPITLNQTGIRSFCSFEDAVLRVQPTGAAIAGEPACQALLPLNQ